MILREFEADERLAGAGGVDDGGLAGVVEHGEDGAIGYLVVGKQRYHIAPPFPMFRQQNNSIDGLIFAWLWFFRTSIHDFLCLNTCGPLYPRYY
ncbi:hypothetical protein SDC9_145380 [bioreactor metagenome]|uniref:Uncharacterized protein n=1 Tax=bioreactor metagenome TaxID=1076179 RepID=A0A645E8G8_9ZZZZ